VTVHTGRICALHAGTGFAYGPHGSPEAAAAPVQGFPGGRARMRRANAHAHISSGSASAAARPAPRGSFGITCRPWRGILRRQAGYGNRSNSSSGVTNPSIRSQVPRGSTHQSHRRMAHLLAPIDVEGALRREAGGYRAV